MLLLTGCLKSPAAPAKLSHTRWEGTIASGPGCEHGGYQGHEMKVCVAFGEVGKGSLEAAVDWDSESLRPACDYFTFSGTAVGDAVSLQRADDPEEADDRFELERSGDRLQGTFQVHPACAPWPVALRLSR